MSQNQPGFLIVKGDQNENLTLKSFRQISVPNHRPVFDADLVKALVDFVHLSHTLVERFLRPEDGGVALHSLLHIQADFRGVLRSVGLADFVEILNRLHAGIVSHLFVWLASVEVFFDVVGTCAAEDNNVQLQCELAKPI